MNAAYDPANVATARAIRTEHVCPPIPSRDFDWTAVFEGYEPGDPVGTGATEAEAIEWLHAEQAVYEERLAARNGGLT